MLILVPSLAWDGSDCRKKILPIPLYWNWAKDKIFTIIFFKSSNPSFLLLLFSVHQQQLQERGENRLEKSLLPSLSFALLFFSFLSSLAFFPISVVSALCILTRMEAPQLKTENSKEFCTVSLEDEVPSPPSSGQNTPRPPRETSVLLDNDEDPLKDFPVESMPSTYRQLMHNSHRAGFSISSGSKKWGRFLCRGSFQSCKFHHRRWGFGYSIPFKCNQQGSLF